MCQEVVIHAMDQKDALGNIEKCLGNIELANSEVVFYSLGKDHALVPLSRSQYIRLSECKGEAAFI